MIRTDRAIVATLALGFVLRSATASGQDDDARARAARLFREATADYEAGRMADAATKFETSNKLVRRAAAIYSAARAWDASGDIERAADDYDGALERTDLHGAEADDARKRLSEIGPRLGIVALDAPEDAHVWIGHVHDELGSVRVHLLPGDYDARVERSGYQPWSKRVHVESGAVVHPGVVLVLVVADNPVQLTRPETAATHPERRWAWIALGVAAAALVTSIVGYAEAVHARDQFEAGGDHDGQQRSTATTWVTVTYVGYAVTGVAAAGGAALFVW
jgi:tetratricopeptide (TPR) repeat protein